MSEKNEFETMSDQLRPATIPNLVQLVSEWLKEREPHFFIHYHSSHDKYFIECLCTEWNYGIVHEETIEFYGSSPIHAADPKSFPKITAALVRAHNTATCGKQIP